MVNLLPTARDWSLTTSDAEHSSRDLPTVTLQFASSVFMLKNLLILRHTVPCYSMHYL